MNNKTKLTISIISTIATIFSVVGTVVFLTDLEWYVRVAIYVCSPLMMIATYVFCVLNKEKLAKSTFVANVTVFVVLLVFFLLSAFGLFSTLGDLSQLKNMIVGSGAWGYAICFAIIIAQVVILPVPATAVYLLIAAIYGGMVSFVICYVSTIIGSVIAFSIGRLYGKKAVTWCVGREQTERWATLLNDKGKVPFVVMQLLPFFPDDVLCMVAGLSSMTYKFFMLTMIFIKPIYIAIACFLGTGNLIPFEGWGIVAWIAIFAAFGVLVVLYLVYQKRIDNYFASKKEKVGK